MKYKEVAALSVFSDSSIVSREFTWNMGNVDLFFCFAQVDFHLMVTVWGRAACKWISFTRSFYVRSLKMQLFCESMMA